MHWPFGPYPQPDLVHSHPRTLHILGAQTHVRVVDIRSFGSRQERSRTRHWPLGATRLEWRLR